jgi:hypothetical protein
MDGFIHLLFYFYTLSSLFCLSRAGGNPCLFFLDSRLRGKYNHLLTLFYFTISFGFPHARDTSVSELAKQ